MSMPTATVNNKKGLDGNGKPISSYWKAKLEAERKGLGEGLDGNGKPLSSYWKAKLEAAERLSHIKDLEGRLSQLQALEIQYQSLFGKYSALHARLARTKDLEGRQSLWEKHLGVLQALEVQYETLWEKHLALQKVAEERLLKLRRRAEQEERERSARKLEATHSALQKVAEERLSKLESSQEERERYVEELEASNEEKDRKLSKRTSEDNSLILGLKRQLRFSEVEREKLAKRLNAVEKSLETGLASEQKLVLSRHPTVGDLFDWLGISREPRVIAKGYQGGVTEIKIHVEEDSVVRVIKAGSMHDGFKTCVSFRDPAEKFGALFYPHKMFNEAKTEDKVFMACNVLGRALVPGSSRPKISPPERYRF